MIDQPMLPGMENPTVPHDDDEEREATLRRLAEMNENMRKHR